MTTSASPSKLRAWLQVHLAVFLFGFTGILGDLIDLPALTLVWWRMLLTAVSLIFMPGVVKDLRGTEIKEILKMMGIGVIVASHWVFFFASIKMTGVSVALACLATAPFFTAIIEPLFLRRKIRFSEIFLGVFVIPGVYLIYQADSAFLPGILVAFLSALGAAVFSVLNKTMVDRHSSVKMTFVELASGALVLSLVLPFVIHANPDANFLPRGMDWLWIGILAFICTSFAFIITLNALKVLPTFSVNLSINLEPVYAIILAAVLLGEHKDLNWLVYVGAGIIVCSVFLNVVFGWWRDRKGKKEAPEPES